MSCDLHTPLWVFTAPPLIPLHTLGAYLHTPSNPAPDNRKNAPPLWQRCAFVSSFSTFASEKKVETSNLYLLFCCFILYIVQYLCFITIYSILLMDGAIRNS